MRVLVVDCLLEFVRLGLDRFLAPFRLGTEEALAAAAAGSRGFRLWVARVDVVGGVASSVVDASVAAAGVDGGAADLFF